ncbi:acyl-CoA dehydrogenase family protein [Fibrella forsythiae]|uniref:Acyl-CoA dehydrogenase family protein n=1 Tax=Fibrella forsythiae TaxID=2817061 RepID=A0ABS3JNM5_9BACT|nr:acyl-CoA dehydrogenase family protein [Fibrella forsythiae]MBO0951611.1 acyl-CoA dehydrogenase family protein [Fibrella forsythiae]
MTSEIVENQVDTVQLIRESVREFALRHLAPHVRDWDERQHFPADEFREMGSLGLLGMLVPETYGGAGLGYHEYVAAIVELSKVDGAVGLSMAAHNSLCTNHILMFGSEEQKQTYLPKLASGEHIGAWGLTEPNTGSDAGNMRTRAVRQENGDWILNGAKNFITHGRSGNVAVVIARTGEPNTPHNATAFVVERNTPGFRGGKKEDKLGMRASETAEMIFEDCRIPDSQRLGEVGAGFVQSLKILDGGRISIAALSLGIAMGAYEAALAYAQERQQFGQPIFNFQGISFKLADMATDIEASRLLIEHAAELKNQHKPVTKASAMAKLFASEVSVRVANEAVQILGGYGYIKDFPVEKFYRDAKLCTIGEGTSEIQKVVIARHIM